MQGLIQAVTRSQYWLEGNLLQKCNTNNWNGNSSNSDNFKNCFETISKNYDNIKFRQNIVNLNTGQFLRLLGTSYHSKCISYTWITLENVLNTLKWLKSSKKNKDAFSMKAPFNHCNLFSADVTNGLEFVSQRGWRGAQEFSIPGWLSFWLF